MYIDEATKLHNLGQSLKGFAPQCIIKTNNHGNYGKGDYIITHDITQALPYKPLINFCRDHDPNNMGRIELSSLLRFFDQVVHDGRKDNAYRGNHCDNTVGKYPMIMSIVWDIYGKNIQRVSSTHPMYGAIVHDIDYSTLREQDEATYQRIKPKRVAFSVLAMLSMNIKRHFGDYLDIEYEGQFENNKKKYDARIYIKDHVMNEWLHKNPENKYLLCTEINEGGHVDDPNDTLKKMQVNAKGVGVIYYVVDSRRTTYEINGMQTDYTYAYMVDVMNECKRALTWASDIFCVRNIFNESRVVAGTYADNYRTIIRQLEEQMNDSDDPMEKEMLEAEIEHKTTEMEHWEMLHDNIGSHTKTIETMYHYGAVGYEVMKMSDTPLAGHIYPLQFMVKTLGLKIDMKTLGLPSMGSGNNKVDKSEKMMECEKRILQFAVRRNVSHVNESTSKYGITDPYTAETNMYFDFVGFSSIINDIEERDLKPLRKMNHRLLTTTREVMIRNINTIIEYGAKRQDMRDSCFGFQLELMKQHFNKTIKDNTEAAQSEITLLKERLDITGKQNTKFYHLAEKSSYLYELSGNVKTGLEYIYGEYQTTMINPAKENLDRVIEDLKLYTKRETTKQIIVQNYPTMGKDIGLCMDSIKYLADLDKTQVMTHYDNMKKANGDLKDRKTLNNEMKTILGSLQPVKEDIIDRINTMEGHVSQVDKYMKVIDEVRDVVQDPILKAMMGLAHPEDLRVLLRPNKSIVPSMPDLPLHYVKDIRHYVTKERAIALLMTNKHMTITKAINILKEFYDRSRGWKWDDPKVIFYLKEVSQEVLESSSDADPDTDSDTESSSDTDSESDASSDASSDTSE
jgi:hypothetical protein